MRRILFFCLAAVVAVVAGLTLLKPHQNWKKIPPTGTIVCFGDSLTSGVGASAGRAYPSQLASRLGGRVINAGRSGDTTQSAARRLQSDVLSHDPAIVIFTLGGNDMLRGVSKDVAFTNLRAMIKTLQEHGVLVVVGGIDIPLWDKGYGEMYGVLCRETGAVCVPNIFEGIWDNQALMSDTIHPNDAGYERIAEKFFRALQPYLQ